MVVLSQQIINGIMLAATYAMIALGLSMIFGILGIPHLAHGSLYMLGGFACYFLMTLYGCNYWVAMILSIAAIALLGMVIERLAYAPLYKATMINLFIVAFGLTLFLENGALNLWGGSYRVIPIVYEHTVEVAGVVLTLQRLIIVLVALVLIALVQLFIKRTTMGACIEAMAQDREGAQLVGVNLRQTAAVIFGIGSALAAAGGCLLGPLFLIHPFMGDWVVMKVMLITIAGGLGSIPGLLIVAFFVGFAESLGAAYVTVAYKDVLIFGLLMLILATRPRGLFGRELLLH